MTISTKISSVFITVLLLSFTNGAVPPLGNNKLSLTPSAAPPGVISPPAISTSLTTTPPTTSLTSNDTTSTGSGGAHSGCYVFFNTKAKCVARTSSNNCPPKKTSIQIEQLTPDDQGLPNGKLATGGVMPPTGVTPPTPTPVKLRRRSGSMFRRSDEEEKEAIEPNVLAAVQPPGERTLGTGPPLSSLGSNSKETTSKSPSSNESATLKSPVSLPGNSSSSPDESATSKSSVGLPSSSSSGDSTDYSVTTPGGSLGGEVTSPGELFGNSTGSPGKSTGGSLTTPVKLSEGPLTPPSGSVTPPGKLPGGSITPPVGSGATPPVSSGSSSVTEGICGSYNTETDLGVCVWSGSDTEGKDVSKSGWVSSSITANCGKEVAVLRKGLTKPVVFKVIDGCNFSTTTPNVGCEQLFLTKQAFKALNPTAEETASGFFKDPLVWDFLAVSNATNVPV